MTTRLNSIHLLMRNHHQSILVTTLWRYCWIQILIVQKCVLLGQLLMYAATLPLWLMWCNKSTKMMSVRTSSESGITLAHIRFPLKLELVKMVRWRWSDVHQELTERCSTFGDLGATTPQIVVFDDFLHLVETYPNSYASCFLGLTAF